MTRELKLKSEVGINLISHGQNILEEETIEGSHRGMSGVRIRRTNGILT